MARKRAYDRDRVRRGAEFDEKLVSFPKPAIKPQPQRFGVKRAVHTVPQQEARGTFKVKAALRNLKEELPDGILHQKRERKVYETKARKAEKAAAAKKSALDMQPPKTCKAPPDSRKKGSGASRPFVPYCK